MGSWPPSLRTTGTSGFAPEIPGAKCRKSTAITHWENHTVLITILAHCCSQWLYSREPGGPRHCQNTAVPLWVPKNCYQNWSLSAPCSKVNKEARLVERKVCSMLDTGNQGGEGVGQVPVQRPHPPPTDNQGVRTFTGRGRGLPAETA